MLQPARLLLRAVLRSPIRHAPLTVTWSSDTRIPSDDDLLQLTRYDGPVLSTAVTPPPPPPSTSSSSSLHALPRFTPGAHISVNYLAGTQSRLWQETFHTAFTSRGLPSAPCYQCPFCFTKAVQQVTAARANAGGSPPLSIPPPSLPWYTPGDVCAHISWLHTAEGSTAAELAPYNQAVLRLLARRCRPPLTRSTLRGPLDSTAESANDAVASVTRRRHRERVRRSVRTRQHSPFRLILVLDVANAEIGFANIVLSFLHRDSKARQLFASVPIAFCAVQELFVRHTACVTHGWYQLAQLHPDSDFYTFYSPSSLEAGDLLSASLLADLRCEAGRDCPPTILLTLDSQLRLLVQQMFGEGATSGCVPTGAFFFSSPTGLISTILKALKDTSFG